MRSADSKLSTWSKYRNLDAKATCDASTGLLRRLRLLAMISNGKQRTEAERPRLSVSNLAAIKLGYACQATAHYST